MACGCSITNPALGKNSGRSSRRAKTRSVGEDGLMWRITGGSWRGISHVRSGLRNQDAIKYSLSPAGDAAVLAVADGHGSALSFRSDLGSRFAVETAVELLEQFARSGVTRGSI